MTSLLLLLGASVGINIYQAVISKAQVDPTLYRALAKVEKRVKALELIAEK